jgi:arylsulfatase
MKRIPRRDDALDRFRGGVNLVAAAGFLAGVVQGMSAVSANRLPDSGLPNLAVEVFVTRLDSVFLGSAVACVPAVFILYVLYRIAPGAFRLATTVLFLLAAILVVSHLGIFGGAPGSGWSLLLVLRRVFLMLLCLAAARLFLEAYPSFRLVQQFASLRILLLILFLFAAANSAAYISRTKNFPRGPNVVLVTFDSVRTDHLGYYGYSRETSPALDRLAEKAVVYMAAFTSAPASAQALASIHTGRFPQAHSVRRLWDPLGKREVTLAEILADKGYVTAGFVCLPSPRGTSGLEQGFDRFLEAPFETQETAVSEAIRWMGRQRKRPFLAWVHLSGAQMPYTPPPEDRMFSDGAYAGPYREEFHYEPTRGCRVFGHEPLSPEDSAQAVALYDGEIRRTDREIDRLLLFLERSDLLHDTLILVVGTHGECLGEHGYFFDHGGLLNDASIRVPMMLTAANLQPRRVPGLVRTVDLLPTVLDILRFPTPPGVGGRSLIGTIERPDDFPSLTVYAESEASLFPALNHDRPIGGIEGKLYAIREGEWKLVRNPRGLGASYELFDLATDPGEMTDRSSEFPDVVAGLRSALDEWRAGFPPPTDEEESRPPEWVFLANDPKSLSPSAPSGIPR